MKNAEEYYRTMFRGRVSSRNLRGSVTAASDWGGEAERKKVRHGLRDSDEALFHETGFGNFMLLLHDVALHGELDRRLQRAIGVIYLPETERTSHYFQASLPEQFDAIIHLDETRALEPLDRRGGEVEEETPETFPSGV